MKRLLIISLLALGCSAPAASVGYGSLPPPIQEELPTPVPSGEVSSDGPQEFECGLPEGCGTLPPTDTGGGQEGAGR